MENNTKKTGFGRYKYLIIFAAAFIVLLFSYFGIEKSGGEVEVFAVQKGEFVVAAEVFGELKAVRTTNVTAPRILRIDLKIVDLAPEGSFVEEGDFLIQFDKSQLEEMLVEKELDLEIQNFELESIISKQRADSIKWENLLQKDQLSFELNKLRFISAKFEAESVRRKMELDLEKAELNLKDKLDNIELEKYDAVKQLKMKQTQIDKLQKSVDEIKENIEKTTVTAPIPGLVVYKDVRNPMGIDQEKIKIGMSGIYYRYPLIELPDISELQAKVDVNENVVGSIKKGHLVIITLESGGNVYYGKVKSVAAIATKEFIDPFISRENSVNVYKVDISVITQNENGVLKPGMLASCRIITDRVKEAVYVPLQSVIEDENGNSFVFVKDNGSFKKTPVVTGIDNRSFIVIKKGLTPGMEVALRDPDKKLIDVGETLEKLDSPGLGSGSINK